MSKRAGLAKQSVRLNVKNLLREEEGVRGNFEFDSRRSKCHRWSLKSEGH
jgi:hypothetical protein